MNTDYCVKLTPHATVQISETIAYISKVLLAPETARSWSDYLQKKIKTLNKMPARYPFVDMEPWKSRGYRYMPVKNFIVYYFIEKKSKVVWVTAVVYARRDQLIALKNMPLKSQIV